MEIGLKIWSINLDYLESIHYIIENQLCDYIELYIVPGTFDNIDFWKQFKIQYILHSPTTLHGLNPANGNIEKNVKLYSEVVAFANILNPKYIIIHPGMGGKISHSIDFFARIDTSAIVVENMPFLSLDDRICIGYSYEQLKKIIESSGVGFCFDISHAIKYAVAKQLDIYNVLRKLEQLNPAMYHISDGFYNNPYDEHLGICNGEFGFKKIFSILNINKKFTLETPKSSNLFHKEFIKDVECLKKFI